MLEMEPGEMAIRRGIAVQDYEERGYLRWALLDLFAGDSAFSTALQELSDAYQVVQGFERPEWGLLAAAVSLEQHRRADWPGEPMDPQVGRYVEAVRALASAWGLDRLQDEGEELGARLVHRWCGDRRQYGTRWTSASFKSQLGIGGGRPDIGGVSTRDEFAAGEAGPPLPDVRPLVSIGFTDGWDPRNEARGSARKRLYRRAAEQIQRELDRLAADAEAKGYFFADRAPALERDLGWLYQMMAKGATAEALAEAEVGDAWVTEAAVARAIRRIAARTGVSTRGWGLSRE
jgi:hypothetical protein